MLYVIFEPMILKYNEIYDHLVNRTNLWRYEIVVLKGVKLWCLGKISLLQEQQLLWISSIVIYHRM